MPVGELGPFATDRLLLRPGEVGDASVFHRLWTERDPRVPPHRRIGADGRPTVEDIAANLVRADPTATGPRLLTVVRQAEGDVIGYCGLNPADDDSSEKAELAYELLRTAQGRGYATEAATAVVGWARASGYRQLGAGVWDWNVASRRVLQKLGFSEVGQVEPTSEHGHTLSTVLTLSRSEVGALRLLRG